MRNKDVVVHSGFHYFGKLFLFSENVFRSGFFRSNFDTKAKRFMAELIRGVTAAAVMRPAAAAMSRGRRDD